ncbi:uroporphyrinogen decarboxylase family protein [Ereboglobus luteus]|nr:uroporphyrinogen decarboxylase family protein [Ereboglobus luteus]
MGMNARERFLNTLNYQCVDRRPCYLAWAWFDTLARWRREGLPADVTDVHEHLGVSEYGYKMCNITPAAGVFPDYPVQTLREDEQFVYRTDRYGRTVKEFKDHSSFPEWLEFPVKTGADLRRLMDEHFDVENLDARFPSDWLGQIRAAGERGDIIMIDGGCYYWTLRSIAGIDGAAYLLYDEPELVGELFERYNTVVMEGLRRAVQVTQIDIIGFGEDFAFKNGPLISPAMFRQMILPHYKKAMDFAHSHNIHLTWHDSDGDCRLLLPDMLSVGVNSTCPCEVASGMDPVDLRRQFGRDLRIGGGFDKRIIPQGRRAMAAEFARLRPVIEEGGYIPGIDHSIPADISYDCYREYIDELINATAWV